jgi:creatinine amidohydrolase/Fe(II)-dependent formamide hydrolase-like protein
MVPGARRRDSRCIRYRTATVLLNDSRGSEEYHNEFVDGRPITAWGDLVAAGVEPGRLPGHAGEFETSIMMSLRPDLVAKQLPSREVPRHPDPPVLPTPYRDERHGAWESINGHTDSPALASAEKGEQFRAVIAKSVAKAWVEYVRSCRCVTG